MQGEVENTEDLEFKKNLTESSGSVQQGELCGGRRVESRCGGVWRGAVVIE